MADSANREMEAHTTMAATTSPSAMGSSSSFVNTMSSMSSMGGFGGMTASSGLPSSIPGMQFGMSLGRGSRRVPTMLDELEWAESDQRRSERERFDILLDRYEM